MRFASSQATALINLIPGCAPGQHWGPPQLPVGDGGRAGTPRVPLAMAFKLGMLQPGEGSRSLRHWYLTRRDWRSSEKKS